MSAAICPARPVRWSSRKPALSGQVRYIPFNPPTFGTFFIQVVHAPFETIRYCGFEWWNNCVQCWFPKWFWMACQLIQNLVWIFPNGSTANTKPCLDTSKWWINGPSKTNWMDLNGSTACYQHCSNGITVCVQNQWAFLKVHILNGFKWSISRRVNRNLFARCFLHVCTLSDTRLLKYIQKQTQK